MMELLGYMIPASSPKGPSSKGPHISSVDGILEPKVPLRLAV